MFQARLAIAVLVALLAAGVMGPSQGSITEWVTLASPAQAPPARVWTPAEWAEFRSDSSDAPSPGIQTGIGPGSAMQQGVGSASFICTAAFLLRDPYTGTYYLSTAGHCLVRDEADPTPYTGAANPEKVDDTILVCVADCIDNALGLGEYVELEAGDGFHPVAFAQSGGVGLDFGIIELPAALHGEFRPSMPMWGGPNGLATSSDNADSVVFYGHGSYCCAVTGAVASRTPADQGRSGVYQGADGGRWDALGWSSGGDSGSGVSLGVLGGSDGLSGGKALGVLTHGTYVANPAASLPIFTGTMLTHGLSMVHEHTGLQLELVLAGDPLPQSPTAAPKPFNVTVATPPDGATVSLGAKKVNVAGSAAKDGDALPDGVSVQVAVDDPDFGADSRIPIIGNSSWNGNWDLVGVSAGPHVLRARLVDADGVVLDLTNVTVTLTSGPASTSGLGSNGASGPGKGTTATSGGAGDDTGEPKRGVGAPGASWVVGVAAVAVLAGLMRRRL